MSPMLTGHWQEKTFGTSAEGDLERFSEVLHGDDIATQAHTSQDNQLRLDRVAQQTGAESHKRGEGYGSCWSGVIEFSRAYGQGVAPAQAMCEAQVQTIAELRAHTTETYGEALAPVKLWAPFIVQQTGV